MSNKRPHLDYLSWRETCSALHLYLQVAGKYRLAHTPWLNHSWNATFYVTSRGLTLGGTPTFDGQPNEVPYPVPFSEDHRDRPYDRDAVQRFHHALLAVDRCSRRSGPPFSAKPAPFPCSGVCMPGRPGQVRRPDAELVKDAPPTTDGTVQREDGASKGRYRIVVDGVEAEMTYSRAGNGLIIIEHTEVPAALRGRKVGERLVRHAIEDARRDGVTIIPLCPFAKAQIGRHPEWQDVLHGS